MKFTEKDTQKLLSIMKSRRDVRGNQFIDRDIESRELELILKAGVTAPSVGYSQPWKFIVIKDIEIKKKVFENFKEENRKAKKIFEKNPLYKRLKLEGILEAPINIAVLYEPRDGDVLGMTSMSRMGEYSVVCAIQNMWLMARTLNIGVGWVSILDEEKVLKILDIEPNRKLIAYLCVGYVKEFYKESELKIAGWEKEKLLKESVEFR
jgi:5,6-dimethylbenzimidazole synthase